MPASSYPVRWSVATLPEEEALLESPLWKNAEELTAFRFPWKPGVVPPRTAFCALWDGVRFAFRFVVEDADLVIGAGDSPGQRALESDRVEIFWARDERLDPYVAFEMNPRGDVLAYEARFQRRMNWDWNCPAWKVAARLVSGGYAVAGTVPMATLKEWGVWRGLADGGGEAMAGLYRGEFSHEPDGGIRREWISWIDPGTPLPDFHVPSSFGLLRFLPRL